MTKSRAFLFLLVSFVAGVGIRSFVAVPSLVILFSLVVAGSLTAVSVSRAEKRMLFLGVFLAAFLFGIVRFELAEVSHPDLSGFFGRETEVRGFVFAEPDIRPAVQQLRVSVEGVDGKSWTDGFTVLATVGRYPEFSLGDEVVLRGVFQAPERLGEFDYPAYLSRENIFVVMSFPKVEKTGESGGAPVKRRLSHIKNAFEANIERALPEPHAAFLKGLLLGERESLPEEVIENFKVTGTTHIVALSGYNITLVGRFIIAGLLLLTVPFRFSFWLASAGVMLFVVVTGASPSVVRAGIMGILVLVAQREGRAYNMTNALVFAGAVMIFENPRILRFDAAFELSFLATAGLLLLTPRVERWVDGAALRLIRWYKHMHGDEARIARYDNAGHRGGFFGFLRTTFVETLSAQLMVLPLIVYLFGRVSLISPFANVAVLLAVPYAMAAGFAASCAGFVSDVLARIIGVGAWALLEYELRVIELFARVPAASVEVGGYATALLFVVYAIAVFKMIKKRSRYGNAAQIQ